MDAKTIIYPAQKAVAFRLIYGPKWRLGERPERVKLGAIEYPAGACIEAGEAALRRAYPKANAFRLWSEIGEMFCCGSL